MNERRQQQHRERKIVAGRETMKEQVQATFREQKNGKGVKGKDASSTGKL